MLSLTEALLVQPNLLRCLGRGAMSSSPSARCQHRLAEGVLAVQAAGDTEQPPLALSPLSDITRYAVRLHHGNPMKDPKPSEARGNIFNDSANGPVFGIPRYN